ncbi:MAG: DinB family protein [Caldilineales bacterium]
MTLVSLFLQRYDPLQTVYLAGFWQDVPHDLMRLRPHERVNSIAWNLWHIARCEDAGVNCFVANGTQVLDEAPWPTRLNLSWRHNGSGMTLAEVDDLNARINLVALQAYMQAVQQRTRALLPTWHEEALQQAPNEQRLQQIMLDEGVAHSNAGGFVRNYLGWSRAKCLFTFALTHSWQHVGEMETLASLLGIEF